MPFDEMNEDHGGGGDGRHDHVDRLADILLGAINPLCDQLDTCATCTAQVLVAEILHKRAELMLKHAGEEAVVADLMELVECLLASVGIEAQTDYRRAPE